MAALADRVHVESSILAYVSRLAEESRRSHETQLGVSVRGCLAMVRAAKTWAASLGRGFVTPDDVKFLALPIFGHRLMLTSRCRVRWRHRRERAPPDPRRRRTPDGARRVTVAPPAEQTAKATPITTTGSTPRPSTPKKPDPKALGFLKGFGDRLRRSLQAFTAYGVIVTVTGVVLWVVAIVLGWREAAVLAGICLVLTIVAILSTLGKDSLLVNLTLAKKRVTVGDPAVGTVLANQPDEPSAGRHQARGARRIGCRAAERPLAAAGPQRGRHRDHPDRPTLGHHRRPRPDGEGRPAGPGPPRVRVVEHHRPLCAPADGPADRIHLGAGQRPRGAVPQRSELQRRRVPHAA